MNPSSAEPDGALHAAALEFSRGAVIPARVGNVHCGTAGWTDPSLLKSHTFYPRGTSKPQARLAHYSQHFPLVEVDASYYSVLAPNLAERWLGWTAPGFCFNVKAHASMTGHPVDVTRLPRELREAGQAWIGDLVRVPAGQLPNEFRTELERGFAAFVAPFLAQARLGCVLFQFPPWFTATRGNARELGSVRERWPDLPIAVEFRHASWLAEERRERVVEWLRELDMSYVVVDEPARGGLGVPPTLLVPSQRLAVLRMHGQNTAGWEGQKTVAERFDYLYSESELRAWVAPVRRLSGEAERVHVVFNNCVRDFAVLNAKGFSRLLSEAIVS